MADHKPTTGGPKPRKSRKRASVVTVREYAPHEIGEALRTAREQITNEPQRSYARFVAPANEPFVLQTFHSQVAQTLDTQGIVQAIALMTSILRVKVGDTLAYSLWLTTFPKPPGAPRGARDPAIDQLLEGFYHELQQTHADWSEIQVIREVHKAFSKAMGGITVQAIERRLERLRQRKQH